MCVCVCGFYFLNTKNDFGLQRYLTSHAGLFSSGVNLNPPTQFLS